MTVPADSPKTAPLMRVRDLSITHDGNSASAPTNVSFDLHRGDVVLVLGPSGAGKSTLALALNGLIPHDIPADVTGSVSVGALTAPPATPAELSPHVAMVFQDPDAQLVTGSVYDEVAFAPENLLFSIDEIHKRVKRSLTTVGLWNHRAVNPDELSGGGRQRLAIACALTMGSRVLVLDEPTANLDPQGIDEVYDALADLVADGERAVVLIEHNLDAAMGFVNRVIALDEQGRIMFDGTVDGILRDKAAELHALGVWLPEATLAALELRSRGVILDPLPLTSTELATALPPRIAPSIRETTKSSGHRLTARPVAATVTSLTFAREGREVLSDVTLEIAAGSFTAIVGANGAGKTTLLQLMCGVIRPPKNTISIAGLDPARSHARKLADRVGFVFQNPEHQFMATTVYDELAYELRVRKRPTAEVHERVTELLGRFGLADKANVHPFLLSGGQKRRLSVGTALLSGAKILALDEPTFGQDRARARELLELLQDLREEGTTIIIVTHDMQLVADYATHMIALGHGHIVAAGTTREVWANSDTLLKNALRLPPVQRALQSRPDYADVWRLADAHVHEFGGVS